MHLILEHSSGNDPNKGEFSIINHAKALNKLFIHLKLQYQLICC